jgi:hypothetical protein
MQPQETYSVQQDRGIWYLVKIVSGGCQKTPFKSYEQASKVLTEIESGPVCTYCGSYLALCLDQLDKEIMLEHTCCANCAFYVQLASRDSGYIFADGCSIYTIGKEDKSNRFRGFGGQKWIITYPDGKVVESTNLWSNGQTCEKLAATFRQAKAKAC